MDANNLKIEKRYKTKRKQMGGKTTEFSKMSEEMVVPILLRLNPETLLRFKCVRRSWNTMISNPSFVAKHLSNIATQKKNSTCVLCKRFVPRDNDEKEAVCSLITFFHGNDADDHEHLPRPVVKDIEFPLSMNLITRSTFPENEILGAVGIKGHCNGIICLVDGCNTVLWNPAIREFKILPEACILDRTLDSVGFGYDTIYNDYKVFSIVSHDEGGTPKVEVYSLSTDSWAEINNDHLETETTNFYPQFFQMYFKGICYWTGCEQQKEFMSYLDEQDEEWIRQLIIIFDLSDGVFADILFPYSLYEPMSPYLEMQIIVWNESVALFGQYRFDVSDAAFGLWIMDDVVKGSWTKHLTLDAILGIWKNLKCWKSDEILMIANDKRILSYNVISQQIEYLPIESLYPDHSEAAVYVKSLVSIIYMESSEPNVVS